jgi:uncharacterized protein
MTPDLSKVAVTSDLPPGYRQGFITAITVTITASILFLRFVVFEPASGDWTRPGAVCAVLAGLSILMQFFTLWRALQPEDEKLRRYRRTLRFFAASVFVLIGSLVVDTYASTSAELTAWLQKPVSEKQIDDLNRTAEAYEEGLGVTQDFVTAVYLYRKAADQGGIISQLKLGAMYEHGRGVPQDYARAYMYYSLAAMRGDGDATKARDELASKMSLEQIAEAQRLSRDWK